LAGIIWRKRRLRLAEAAAHHRGLQTIARGRDTVAAALSHLIAGKPSERVLDAILATPTETGEKMREVDGDELLTRLSIFCVLAIPILMRKPSRFCPGISKHGGRRCLPASLTISTGKRHLPRQI
jgi:hypothetical protein